MAKFREIAPLNETYCYKDVSSEEELKLRIAHDWFEKFSCDKREDGIDFWVLPKGQLTLKGMTIEQPLLWAEAKKGTSFPIDDSFVQLILTIGKHRTNSRFPAPAFLGAFDAEKMAFIRYDSVMEVFSQNDFNWNVTPSNKKTKEFIQLKKMVSSSLDRKLVFRYEDNAEELRSFIKNNIGIENSDELRLIEVTPNNVVYIFNNWLKFVRDTIDVPSWEELRKSGITEADFFLAGLVSKNNVYLEDKKDMQVRLNGDRFEIVQATGTLGDLRATIGFRDGQRAQKKFWDMYRRPPTPRHCREILDRRDLLVPQDFRERKGAYFTPPIWVEKSQQYIADVLGEDWQDEYYVWDCCAGTGNLLNGLKNKDKIYASTLDDADVRIMKERIKSNSANLFESHVFQFDFLNDDLNSEKVPKPLRDILNDEDRRKRLVIYINPPYAEHGNASLRKGKAIQNKAGVATSSFIYRKYSKELGGAFRQLFAHFLIRIYKEIDGCVLSQFSTLSMFSAPNFKKFRSVFRAIAKKGFIVPSGSFENVEGGWPIGFFVWDCSRKIGQNYIVADILDENGDVINKKSLSDGPRKYVIDWLKLYHDKENQNTLGYLRMCGTDFQHNDDIFVCSHLSKNDIKERLFTPITENNIFVCAIYSTIRHVVQHTWVNGSDNFIFPHADVLEDKEFISDCLAFVIFDDQNTVSMIDGPNHWIPFSEEEIQSRDCFSSHFMTDFIKKNKILFSKEASAVMESGRLLWKYYHSKQHSAPNASIFDIRRYFQCSNNSINSKMPDFRKCEDAEYVRLKTCLNDSMKVLAKKIESKVYEHGFLLRSVIETNEDDSA